MTNESEAPEVIDLRPPAVDRSSAPRTRVAVNRADNPFADMSEQERMRLIIRVICELVAYDEPEAGLHSA